MLLLSFSNPFSLLLLSLPFFTTMTVSSDHTTTLVFKGCADQKFQDPTGVYAQTLKTLFATLQSQSSAAKFFKTTAGQDQSAILGVFQCRGDLSNAACNNCVSKLPDMSRRLCGDTIAARVQLVGCYFRYEVAGFNHVSATELLYKECEAARAEGDGFEDRLGTALGEIEKGVEGGGSGFYAGSYEAVFVLGQCEGDLGSGDCVDCLKSAVEMAKNECAAAISGQIYLYQCYISYAYYPNGVPTKSLSGGSTQNTQKTVAIVVGGVAGFGFGIACLLFLRSAFKKREGKYGG
ncbi:hypothetical protein U1Q18_033949 [Sarracenia purpurea var. burkii]